MPDIKLKKIKDRYQNGKDNIGKDFMRPCLELCTHYRRGTGFFSSSALKSYSGSLGRIITDDVKIDIICSPVVQDRSFIKTLEFNSTSADRERTIRMFSEKVVLMAAGYRQNPERRDYRSKILSYLIATEQMEFKFAIPRDFDWPIEDETTNNIYHVKMGYFKFPGGDFVAFDGSFNESDSGHRYHIDRTQVYRSWVTGDKERLQGVIEDVDWDWEEANPFIEYYSLSQDTIDLIKKLSPGKRPKPDNPKVKPQKPSVKPIEDVTKINDYLWRHQKEAITEFLEHKVGVLEMATGTGKTTTALEIVRLLIAQGKVKNVVISTYGTDLLDQWYKELLKWCTKENASLGEIPIFRSYESNDDLQAALNFSGTKILLISRDANRLYRLLSSRQFEKGSSIIIHDEIHGFGSPSLVSKLSGQHREIAYRLGLSATPEREYDQVGTDFIQSEIGDVLYEFPLNKAIEANILCEFDYRFQEFELTQNDRNHRKGVFTRQARAAKEGNPWSDERLFIELSRIVKTAEQKPSALDSFLQKNPESIKSSIFFVLDREQGNEICNIVSNYTHKYKTYYAGTESEYLDMLGSRKIDSLIACERLNEGIDIKGLNSVFLIASPNSKIDTIQRIGRCLRKNPSEPAKKALVFDLILREDSTDGNEKADIRRMKWLEEISKSKNIN